MDWSQSIEVDINGGLEPGIAIDVDINGGLETVYRCRHKWWVGASL